MELFDLGREPIHRKQVPFGGYPAHERGFAIAEDCTAYGTCAESCPQQCIKKGGIYRIQPEHRLLHCELREESRSFGAIERA